MANYIITPKGNLLDPSVIGRIRSNDDGGLLIFGKGEEGLIEYEPCPRDVARAWRDALVEYMQQFQSRRPGEPPKWSDIAAKIDPTWAKANGHQAAVTPASPARS